MELLLHILKLSQQPVVATHQQDIVRITWNTVSITLRYIQHCIRYSQHNIRYSRLYNYKRSQVGRGLQILATRSSSLPSPRAQPPCSAHRMVLMVRRANEGASEVQVPNAALRDEACGCDTSPGHGQHHIRYSQHPTQVHSALY